MPLFRRTTAPEAATNASHCLAGYNPCGQDLPANFCCSSDRFCIVLASFTTALCCPNGYTCDDITTITCDVESMNVTAHPDSQVLTTALDSGLPTCGNSTCCPFGYECASVDNTSYCAMAEDQAAYTWLVPHQTESVPATTSQSTATPTADSTRSTTLPLPSGTASADTTTSPDTEAVKPRSAGIIAGSVLGAIVIFVGLGLFFWARKRKLSKSPGSTCMLSAPRHQHQWQYRPTAHDSPKSDPTDGSQITPTAYCEAPAVSPAHVSHAAFAELDGTRAYQQTPSDAQVAQPPPVELPASPVSLSMWSGQPQGRRSQRDSITRGMSVPLSRFAATLGDGFSDDRGEWK